MWPCIVTDFLIIKPTRYTNFSNLFLEMKLYMFQTVPLSIIRSYSLCTQQWQDQDVPSWSCSKAVYKPVWHAPLLNVQWITPDDGQGNCPKHVEFYFQNKFEKLVHLVGFIVGKLLMSYPVVVQDPNTSHEYDVFGWARKRRRNIPCPCRESNCGIPSRILGCGTVCGIRATPEGWNNTQNKLDTCKASTSLS
jgi:hypothetical protein